MNKYPLISYYTGILVYFDNYYDKDHEIHNGVESWIYDVETRFMNILVDQLDWDFFE